MLVPKRNSNRLAGYDYSTPGYYFVTICTAGNRNLFGRIGQQNTVELSMLGRIADEIWQRNNQVYSNVSNDLYRIMPNHLHALLLLEHHGADAERPPKLGTVINSFKGAVTKEARLTTGNPGLAIWQNGFHEKIVNSEVSLNRIRQYILYNPHLDELRRTGGA